MVKKLLGTGSMTMLQRGRAFEGAEMPPVVWFGRFLRHASTGRRF